MSRGDFSDNEATKGESVVTKGESVATKGKFVATKGKFVATKGDFRYVTIWRRRRGSRPPRAYP